MSPGRFVFLICLAETLSMTGTMYFPALLPSFQAEWGLTNTAAGWINGVFFAGYAITSPILVGLTDRVDARRIYLPCGRPGVPLPVSFRVVRRGDLDGGSPSTAGGDWPCGNLHAGAQGAERQRRRGRSRAATSFSTRQPTGSVRLFPSTLPGSSNRLIGWRWGAELLALGPLGAMLIFAAIVPPRKPLGHGAGLAVLGK